MKEKMKQLEAILNDIKKLNPKATLVVIVDTNNHQQVCIHGNALEIAATIATVMGDTNDFDKVIEMSLDAYKNVIRK